MLIAVMKPFTMGTDLFWKYVPEVLLIDDVLTRTDDDYDPESLLCDLIIFKEKFDKNHRYLVSLSLT